MNVIDLESDDDDDAVIVVSTKSKGHLLLAKLDEEESKQNSFSSDEEEVPILNKKRKSIDELLSVSLLPPLKKTRTNSDSVVPTSSQEVTNASASREESLSQLDKDSQNEYQARARGDFAFDELQIVLDSDLLKHCGNTVLTDRLKELFTQFSSKKNNVSHSILFYRKLPQQFSNLFTEHFSTHHSQSQTDEEEELQILEVDYLVLLFTAEMLCKLIESKSLQQYVNQINILHPKKTLVILVEGIHQHVKTLEQARYKKILEMQNNKNQQPIQFKKVNTLQEIDLEIVDLELNSRCLVYHCKNVQESICTIVNICKSVAEAPYKAAKQFDLNLKSSNKKTSTAEYWTKYKRLKEKHKNTNEEEEEEEEAVESIALIKSLQMKEVWVKQLMEIPKVSENAAKCIAEKYPSFSSLMRQYLHSEKTDLEKRELLKELKIQDTRKVGPSASNKIFEFFTRRVL